MASSEFRVNALEEIYTEFSSNPIFSGLCLGHRVEKMAVVPTVYNEEIGPIT